MQVRNLAFGTLSLAVVLSVVAAAQTTPPDPIKTMVDRLELQKYKATVKGLTQFGDRRQGTDRNRAAVDWIEGQLKAYGCPTESNQVCLRSTASRRKRRRTRPRQHRPGGWRRATPRRQDSDRRQYRSDEAAGRAHPRARHAAGDQWPPRGGVLHQGRHHPPRRDVHRQRSHGRTWLERGGERRWLGDRAGDGARARVQQPRCDRPNERSASSSGTTRKPDRRRHAPTSSSGSRCREKRTRQARSDSPNRNGSA